MERKLDVDRLNKEELTYELKVRGCFEDGAVEKLRKDMRCALKAEKNRSFVMPEYPFKYEEDKAALLTIILEIQRLIQEFSGTSSSSSFKKIETKLTHAFTRLDRSQAITKEEKEDRSKLLFELVKLESEIGDKIKISQRSTPVKTALDHTLASTIHNLDIHSSHSDISSEDDENGEVVKMKAIPVVQWKIKFSGDKTDTSLHGFLERVDELRFARNISKQQLFRSAIDLFEGAALIWFRANRQKFSNWNELVKGLENTFLPPYYEERLYDEIRRRTQGKDENIDVYVSVMKSLFNRLHVKISENVKLGILMKNITPFYQQQLALTDVRSVDELVTLCKKLEERKIAIENFIPPPRRFETFEPALAYVKHTDNISVVDHDTVPSTSRATTQNQNMNNRKCFNCLQVGHFAKYCRAPRKRYCFKCKRPDVTIKTCPACNQGNGRRE